MAFDVFEHGAALAVAAAAPEFEAAADATAAAAAESGPVEMAHCLSVCFEACPSYLSVMQLSWQAFRHERDGATEVLTPDGIAESQIQPEAVPHCSELPSLAKRKAQAASGVQLLLRSAHVCEVSLIIEKATKMPCLRSAPRPPGKA